MPNLRHLFPPGTATREQYTYSHVVRGGNFNVPPRDDRVAHGARLVDEIHTAQQERERTIDALSPEQRPKGVVLDFQSDPGFKLQLEKLENRTEGFELRSSRVEDGVMHATVFVPEGRVGAFVRKLEDYAHRNTSTGKPKNKDLAESISGIRLASLKSFWTDAGAFPEAAASRWWEIWLHEATIPHDVAEVFRERAGAAGVQVSVRALRFPERRVLLALATPAQFASIPDLFDILAELRLAKTLPGQFLELPLREQTALVEAAQARIQAPTATAASVCHLDTGINRGHPLLASAIDPLHLLSVDPDWSPTDNKGHGTEMAGIALYGCLTDLLGHNNPVVLRHRLESVKILPDRGANAPDLYGEVTVQAVARIETAAPERLQRAFCLTVTADGRDEGYPSSWSASVDQIAAAVEGGGAPRRLLIVSAGNVPLELRHEYPNRNYLEGIEDPAQAWNALSVGAYTERTQIRQAGFEHWHPIAPPGRLSPASRTSDVWDDRSWALKPDIVMEGGNNAIDPATRLADFIDDLSLLTTRMSPAGASLTTTGDTSAAAALAARYAAIVWSQYPTLRPETVRGLLIHSARWTNAMNQEFSTDKQSRMRCYGYGVPQLEKALWSAQNAATLVVESVLQPFDKVGSTVKTKDMHLHRLPWPTAVLEQLGEVPVQMRITLSYFIEPSPGRRGWTKKHRYQSHGLRFDVKRPLETEDDFHRRISRDAWDDDEEAIDHGTDDRGWVVGPRLRCKGSIHSDTWTGTAAQLAACGVAAVYPVTGWWKERAHLNSWNRQARYSLIISIETPSADVDLYTPIAASIGVPVEIATPL